jgi:hypothetical protein
VGNFMTYFLLVATTLCFCYSCAYCYRSRCDGDYDLDGALKELLRRRKGGKRTIDEGSGHGSDGIVAGSADISSEKSFVRNDVGYSA